ncbi:MAG: FGGY-family carbohydrate kinase, partial [Eubacteriales bacterium]
CGVPVAAGAGDNAAAAVGTGIVENGRAFTTIGTSGVVFAHTDEPLIDPKGRIHTFCCAVPGKWHVMGVTQAAGLSLKWFRDNFCELETMNAEKQNADVYVLLDEKAKTSPIGANHLVYLPYLMGERTPHLDPDARGVFFGLSAMHTKADLLRAILEGVSFSLYDCVNLLKETGAEVSDMTICGGGGKSPFWSQMLSNVYGTEIKTVACSEGPAYGAAILASVSARAFDTVESACKALIRSGKTFVPNETEHGAYQAVYGLYQSLYPSLKNLYQQLK